MRTRGTDIELNLGELPAIPAGWKWGRVEDAASEERNAIVDGPFGSNLKLSDYIDPPGVPVLTTANLRGDYSPTSVRYISQTKFEELRRSEVRGGDILVAKIGSCGLTGVYPEEMPSAIIPANLLKMTVHPNASRKFVLYYLNSPTFSRFLKTIITATAQPAFNVSKFRQLPLPIAPRPAQNRIVAEIEKQFTRLEAGVAALRRVQANLKRYRAAVLKAACEGRLVLTEAQLANTENRKSKFETGEALLARILTERRQSWHGRGQYKEPATPDTTKLPQMPEGWIWATAQQLNLSNRPCAYGVLQPGEDIADGVPFVRVGDINNGKVDLSNLKRISVTIAAQYPRTKLHGGELAITLVGAIGRTAIIPEGLAGGNTARAVGIIPLTKETNAHWVDIWFRNPAKAAEMDSKSHEVARKTLNLEDVRVASVALPPLAEQTRIVAEVERRLSVVEGLEAVVATNLQRATCLRQSILQKAFNGQLRFDRSLTDHTTAEAP